MIYLYYSDRFSEYDFGPHHPLRPVRLTLTYKLMEDYGLLDGEDIKVVEPSLAGAEELLSVHTPEYLEAVRSEMPNVLFGLGIGDNPVFSGIYDASRLVAGGSIDAARRIAEEDCSAFNFAGGLHHAMPDRASGFCIFNDPALAIRVLRKRFDRVLYVDIDAHHGDAGSRRSSIGTRVSSPYRSTSREGTYFPAPASSTNEGKGRAKDTR